jgi:archaellin
MNELTDRDESGLGWVYPPQPQQTFIQEIIGMISGMTELVEGQDYIDVGFGTSQPTADWVLIEASIFNTTDGTPINIWPGVVTSKTTTGFRLQLNGTPDSGSYFLTWSIRGVFGYYLSGPTSGRRNVASSPFTVRLPDESTLAGTVIITPNDGGAGGTFTPSTVALTVAALSATFTYTPTTYGPRSIGTNNDRGLVDPAEIGFTSTAATYTLDGPAAGGVGEPSTDFTVALPVGGTVIGSVTVTPSDGGDGGTFTPTTVALTTGAPSATFTYTAASTGAKTISVTNNGGLTNPGNLTYTASLVQHLLNTLISYWKLDEASGTRVDSHGTNDLSDNNSVASTTGMINNGADFVAANSTYLSHASNASLQVTGDFTFSLWVKLSSQGGGGSDNCVFAKDAVAGAGTGDYTLDYQTGGAGFYFGVNGAAAYAAVGSNTSNGVWTHLVAWYDASDQKCRLRVDDTTTYVSAATSALVQGTAAFRVGARDNIAVPGYIDAVVDEIGFWKRKLTAVEITALYNTGAGLPYSSFNA